MSSTSILYAHNGNNIDALQQLVVQGVTLKVLNPWSLSISAPKVKHDAFLALFENNPDFAIIRDDGASTAFKAKLRRLTDATKKTKPNATASNSTPLATTNFGRTGTYMAQYYNFPAFNKTAANPVIAVISLGGGYQLSDLQYYWKTVCGLSTLPTVINAPIGQASVPKFTGSDSDVENTLDLELIGSIANNATILFVSVPNTNSGFYNAFATAIAGITIAGVLYKPTIYSCSWGAPEPDFGNSALTAFNALFQQMTKLGITICVAAGDSGASDGYSTSTPTADFPSSSPYVVCCGGSSLSGGTETAWSWNKSEQWGTGSGASSLFAMPSWQSNVVSLPSNVTPSVSNLKGKRAMPDIALNADPLSGITIYFGGKLLENELGGTSCVAPMMSGFLGLINLQYSSVPFANYLYTAYAQSTAPFNDIVSGTNDNLSRGTGVWSASKGFDYCTGLGSFNGTKLLAALTAAGLAPFKKAVVSIPPSPAVVGLRAFAKGRPRHGQQNL